MHAVGQTDLRLKDALHRVAYAEKLVRHGPIPLWGALLEERAFPDSWLRLVTSDLTCVRQVLHPKDADNVEQPQGYQQWCELAFQQPGRLVTTTKRAIKAYNLQLHIWARLISHLALLSDTCIVLGGSASCQALQPRTRWPFFMSRLRSSLI